MSGAAAILGRVEASVSTTAVGTAAATSTVTPAAAWPGRPGFAASSSTSAGEPPDPAFEATVRFCADYDQTSFDPDYDTLPIDRFVPMVERIFARQPWGAHTARDWPAPG